MTQGSEKVIHVYTTNSAVESFSKVMIVSDKVFSRYTG